MQTGRSRLRDDCGTICSILEPGVETTSNWRMICHERIEGWGSWRILQEAIEIRFLSRSSCFNFVPVTHIDGRQD